MSGFSRRTTRDDIKDKFKTYGKIHDIKLKNGFAFIVSGSPPSICEHSHLKKLPSPVPNYKFSSLRASEGPRASSKRPNLRAIQSTFSHKTQIILGRGQSLIPSIIPEAIGSPDCLGIMLCPRIPAAGS